MARCRHRRGRPKSNHRQTMVPEQKTKSDWMIFTTGEAMISSQCDANLMVYCQQSQWAQTGNLIIHFQHYKHQSFYQHRTTHTSVKVSITNLMTISTVRPLGNKRVWNQTDKSVSWMTRRTQGKGKIDMWLELSDTFIIRVMNKT